MASPAHNQSNDQTRLDDQELANQRRREAVLKLTMNERLERLSSLCRQMSQIKGIARR